MANLQSNTIRFLGVNITPEINFGHILQLIMIIVAGVGLALGGQRWITAVEYEIKGLTQTIVQENLHISRLDDKYETIDERLSRMEGKVDSIDKAVK